MAEGKGVVLGYLKYVLGFDSLAFQEGIGDAGKRMKAAQRSLTKSAEKFKSIGAIMSVGITAPLTALVASSIPAAKESAEALGQVQSALTSMGNAAQRTLPQLQDQAKALMHLSTFDDDDIMRKVTANLLTFGKVSGPIFDRAQQAAVNLSARLGQDLQSSAIQLGKALNDPIKGITALARVGVSFTAQQKEQIKAMVAAGDVAGAQGLILGELERQYGGAAKALRDATPGIESQQAWADFQETIGGIALKVLPPLSKILAEVLNWFNQLSPEVQTLAVAAAAGAAALGPLALGFGSLLQVAAPVLARLALAAGAGGLPALTAVMGPLALGVAGVVIAWKNWDKIGPWIDGVVQRTGAASAKIDGYFKSLNDWADNTDKRLGVPSRGELFESIGAWLKKTWDWANTYDLSRWAKGVDASIAEMARSAIASMQQLYSGVKTWIVDRLNEVWQSVSAKIEWVRQKFFNLYDAVVGHSYIPDMVDQIGQHMARLDQNMVQVAHKATAGTKQAFEQLGRDVQGILDRLFPEEARLIQFKSDQAKIAADPKLPPGLRDEAQKRLKNEYLNDVFPKLFEDSARSVAAAGTVAASVADQAQNSWHEVAATTQGIQQSFSSTAETIGGTLESIVGLFRGNGSWLEKAAGAIELGARAYGQITGKFSGFRAMGGPVMGRNSYMVGERGPELFTPSRSGYVTPNKALGSGRGAPAVVQLVVKPGQLFEPMVTAISGGVAVEQVTRAGRGAARSQRQQI